MFFFSSVNISFYNFNLQTCCFLVLKSPTYIMYTQHSPGFPLDRYIPLTVLNYQLKVKQEAWIFKLSQLQSYSTYALFPPYVTFLTIGSACQGLASKLLQIMTFEDFFFCWLFLQLTWLNVYWFLFLLNFSCFAFNFFFNTLKFSDLLPVDWNWFNILLYTSRAYFI